MHFKKSHLIQWLDLISFVALLFMMSSGLLMQFVLPPRSQGATVWGMTRHEWGGLHFYLSLIFLTLMVCHLLIHIPYIKHAFMGRASREHGYRLAIGVFALIMLLIVAFSPVIVPID